MLFNTLLNYKCFVKISPQIADIVHLQMRQTWLHHRSAQVIRGLLFLHHLSSKAAFQNMWVVRGFFLTRTFVKATQNRTQQLMDYRTSNYEERVEIFNCHSKLKPKLDQSMCAIQSSRNITELLTLNQNLARERAQFKVLKIYQIFLVWVFCCAQFKVLEI